MTISGIIMMTLLVVGLAVMCGVISAALRQYASLMWMGTALVIGVLESLALRDGTITSLDLFAVCVTIPMSYTCVGESVRMAYGAPRSDKRYFALIGALIGLSVVMLLLPLAPVIQMLPCQMAGAWAMLRTIAWVKRDRTCHGRLDTAMLVALVCVTLVYVARIPFLPLLVSLETPFLVMPRQVLQDILIVIFAILVPAVVVLTVAKVVAGAVDHQRMRAEFDIVSALPNRRAFEGVMHHPARGPGYLIVCDIDKFKLVNDRFGHAAGDAVIRAVAGLLDGQGMAARVGGEEFAVWLPGDDHARAAARAEELRREIASLRLVEIVGDHQVTASFGIARVHAKAPLHDVFAAADVALYRAKNAGRNRVVMFEEQDWQDDRRKLRAIRRAAA